MLQGGTLPRSSSYLCYIESIDYYTKASICKMGNIRIDPATKTEFLHYSMLGNMGGREMGGGGGGGGVWMSEKERVALVGEPSEVLARTVGEGVRK